MRGERNVTETLPTTNRESSDARTLDPEATALWVIKWRIKPGYKPISPAARSDQLNDLGLWVNEALRDATLDDAARERIVASLFRRAQEAHLTTKQYFVLVGALTLNLIPGADTQQTHPVALAHSAMFIVNTFPTLDRNADTAHLVTALTRHLLSHQGLPSEAARRLCEAVLTRNPRELGRVQVRREALQHPECPLELLEQAAWSPDYLYREAVRLNPKCPDALRVAASLLDDSMGRRSDMAARSGLI